MKGSRSVRQAVEDLLQPVPRVQGSEGRSAVDGEKGKTHRSSVSKSDGSFGLLLTTFAVPLMYCCLPLLPDDELDDVEELLSFFLTCHTAIPAATPATTSSATPAKIHFLVALIDPFGPL